MTEPLFREDPYLRNCEARVAAINERGGIVLDRTVFYPHGGGQPGDSGQLVFDGGTIEIATTVYDENRSDIVHVPAEGASLPEPGATVTGALDWERRHAHMRMHTGLHLLCAVVPFAVTGGQIGAQGSRLDFDIEDASLIDKDDLTEKLQALIAGDHEVAERWITDAELEANPGLVRTMSVKPPTGSGTVRLVAIGNGEVDLQPCGGTHVARTAEIGPLAVQKIQKKGRMNRRVRIAFAD